MTVLRPLQHSMYNWNTRRLLLQRGGMTIKEQERIGPNFIVYIKFYNRLYSVHRVNSVWAIRLTELSNTSCPIVLCHVKTIEYMICEYAGTKLWLELIWSIHSPTWLHCLYDQFLRSTMMFGIILSFNLIARFNVLNWLCSIKLNYCVHNQSDIS